VLFFTKKSTAQPCRQGWEMALAIWVGIAKKAKATKHRTIGRVLLLWFFFAWLLDSGNFL
jgi:hypothetical protein